jgi:hypothetical protein
VPSKSDEISNQNQRGERIEEYKKAAVQWVKRQIRWTEKKLNKLKSKNKDFRHTENVLRKYCMFKQEIEKGEEGKMMCVTTCKNYSSIEHLLNMIQENSLKNKVALPRTACRLYEYIGKIGLKQKKENRTTQNLKAVPSDPIKTQPGNDISEEISSKIEDTVASDVAETTAISLDPVSPDSSSSEGKKKEDPVLFKIKPLSYVKFVDALDIYRNIVAELAVDVHAVEYKEIPVQEKLTCALTLEEKLTRDLTHLHNRGLMFYFSSVPELKQMIFNDMAEFISVFKQLLMHNYEENMTIKQIHVQLQGVGENKIDDAQLRAYKKMIQSSGMMPCILLKNIAIQLEIEMISLLALLMNLNIGVPIVPNQLELSSTEELDLHKTCNIYEKDLKNNYIFVPYYLKNIHKVTEVEINLNKYQLQTQFKGSLPDSVLHILLISVFKQLITHSTNEIIHASNGLTVKISNIILNVTVSDDKDIINIFIQCPIDFIEINHLWDIWRKCCKAVVDLQCWFPELYSDAYLMCSHCLIKDSAIVELIPVDNVKANTSMFVQCNGDTRIPSALIYPPGNKL